MRGAIFSSLAVLSGASREEGTDVFCLLQAGLAGRSMIKEDWNADTGDKALLPSLEKVLRLGGDSYGDGVCLLFPFLPPAGVPAT